MTEQRMSAGELAIWAQLQTIGGNWVREYRFAPPRRWRFDFANIGAKIAIEVDGGAKAHAWVSGREKDYEKQNEAMARGWRVLRGSTEQAENGWLIAYVKRLVNAPRRPLGADLSDFHPDKGRF
jgi:very-short-patch-repair endonuclease